MTKKVCNEKIPRRSRDFAEESSRKCRERAVSREPWANIFEIFYFVSEPWASELRILQISTLVSERERAGSKIPWAWASKLAPLARSRLAHGSSSHYLEHCGGITWKTAWEFLDEKSNRRPDQIMGRLLSLITSPKDRFRQSMHVEYFKTCNYLFSKLPWKSSEW